MNKLTRAGDFTGLAKNYSENRPDYCRTVLKGLLGLFDKPINNVDFVDVGAGTGIWTRMVQGAGVRSVRAVEPNEDMRAAGEADCGDAGVVWSAGRAEAIDLADGSADWLSMASSFHWADFELATQEFFRVLRPSGWFTAIWNPRFIESDPLLMEIEARLRELQPDLNRVSSGRSGITETLTERLWASQYFDDVVYLEGRHTIEMNPDRYLGAWRSVNDVRVQLGPKKFESFLRFVEAKIADLSLIKATYMTRAWSAQRIS